MKLEEMDLGELIEKWRDENKAHSMEMATGVRKLEKLLEAIGYKERGDFVNADAIWNFLSDNSGAIEAIIEWISERDVEEWKEELRKGLTPSEEEEDES